MACPCSSPLSGESGVDGERNCNSCSTYNYIFFSGIFNIVRECDGKDVVVCQGGQQVDEFYRINKESCELKIIFGLRN